MRHIVKSFLLAVALVGTSSISKSETVHGVPVKGYISGYPIVAADDLKNLPAHVIIAPASYPASKTKVAIPHGYRAAWEDGRLNPLRGVRRQAGEVMTLSIWSDTVPRKLIREQTVIVE
ncbi:hypothetical protein SAMN04488030_1931 [Aliiroseovarius halocynthiae]|uniref:Uncharacterized protein n=1 Tax=Aliiroseovarius halocynthiae TaxID=985055 RepID=A0A545SRD6_9RHOB|nr:hypothetical protein [Aliiroseovarius halocynthiae]TQV67456.1 hypothetical protein FIL88_09530 [Aliiroseovarius halocynthiae]SMR81464.1 hypothetical protein SAMN04488030_1931 [Aliiroseovarius halocynthiae]